jgi:hypothetical protein
MEKFENTVRMGKGAEKNNARRLPPSHLLD